MTISEFQKIWQSKIENEILKSFPDAFIDDSDFELLDLPGKPLIKGSELFGTYEIIDTDGEVLLTTDNVYKIKYILYANRNKPTQIKLLLESDLEIVVKDFEKHLDEIVKMINVDFKKHFPSSENTTSVSSKIFKLLNLYRH